MPRGLVRGERRCTADGASHLIIELSAEARACASLDMPQQFLWIDVPFAPGDALPRVFEVGGAASEGASACHTRPATGSRCNPVAGEVVLQAVVPGRSAVGSVELDLGGGELAVGRFEVDWCGGKFEVAACPHSGAAMEPASTSTPGPAKAGTCSAKAPQCCLEDGTVVTPGGCQPSYPDNVRPATERGPDGFCRSIPCYLKCLPQTAEIATPEGGRPIAELEIGDLVWTVDEHGQRVAEPIVLASQAPIAADHELVELALDDGRVVRASAGHPTATDILLGDVEPRDQLDGATVVSVHRRPYLGRHTRDILPAGATGFYWADGVLVGSTLSRP